MVLNVRERQIDAVVRLLHFNAPSGAGGKAQDEAYKVLILDNQTKDIIAPLLPVSELRRHGVTLHLLLEGEREPIPDVPAVYLVRPSESAVDRIAQDCAAGLYDSLHLNFSTHLSRPLLERLASRVAASGSGAGRVARVHDQYLQYTALEPGLFTLDL
ncbi:Sec1 family protein, partial [Helicosporidium sp. ATCC 50920]